MQPFNEYMSQTPQKNEKSLLWSCGLQDADHDLALAVQERLSLVQPAA